MRVDWGKLKEAADNSLYVKCKHVLGYRDMRPEPHVEMAQFLEALPFGEDHPLKYRLLLVPRDCFKSTMGSVALPLDVIPKYPDISILLSSENYKKSQSFLSEIKQHMEKNQVYRRLYGDLVSDTLWSRSSIITANRRVPNKTPTIDTTGIGASMTSQHYDIIILDDPHSLMNYSTPEQRKKVVDHISDLRGLLKPHGFMVIIGTKWHPYDAYTWIQNSFQPLKAMVRSWKQDGKLFFPARLTEKFVLSQKKVLTDAGNAKLFYAWYENNPITSEQVHINAEWRQLVPMVYIPRMWDYGDIVINPGQPNEEKQFVKICGVSDPADSDKSTADWTGITMKGIDKDGRWYVFEAVKYQHIAALTIADVVKLALKYKCSSWGVEVSGGRSAYVLMLQEAFIKQGVLGRITELHSQNRAKSSRIEALVPRFQAMTVFIGTHCTPLIEELDYPEVSHDDVIDSLAYHNLMDITPNVGEQVAVTGVTDVYETHPRDRQKHKSVLTRDYMTGY